MQNGDVVLLENTVTERKKQRTKKFQQRSWLLWQMFFCK